MDPNYRVYFFTKSFYKNLMCFGIHKHDVMACSLVFQMSCFFFFSFCNIFKLYYLKSLKCPLEFLKFQYHFFFQKFINTQVQMMSAFNIFEIHTRNLWIQVKKHALFIRTERNLIRRMYKFYNIQNSQSLLCTLAFKSSIKNQRGRDFNISIDHLRTFRWLEFWN